MLRLFLYEIALEVFNEITMKKTLRIIGIFGLLFLLSCSKNKEVKDGREITDAIGRKVMIPKTVNKIIGVNAGALRMLTYVATEMVVGVEQVEIKQGIAPYNYLNPELHKLTPIGPRFGGDAELIMKANPDVVFTTFSTSVDADALQKKLGIPVISITNPEFAAEKNKWFENIKIIANVVNKPERAENLIQFIEKNIQELQQRTSAIQQDKRPSVYIGGVSARGAHGITSTRSYYPPFMFVNAFNIASTLENNYRPKTTEESPKENSKQPNKENAKGKGGRSPMGNTTFIDQEKLLQWNPDILFLDAGGFEMIKKEMDPAKPLVKNLKAVQNNQMYSVHPYNAYSTNYEMILANAWYIAKCLYPEEFKEVNITQKLQEILKAYYRKDVEVKQFEKYFRKIDKTEFGQ